MNYLKSKRGEIVLRDLFFMIIIFGSFMALMSLVVFSMADEYDNTNMTAEYQGSNISGLGNTIILNTENATGQMREATDGGGSEGTDNLLSSFSNIFGIINGAGKILKTVVTFPFYIGNYTEILLNAMYLPSTLVFLIGKAIVMLIYGIVIFVIISALLKGGRV